MSAVVYADAPAVSQADRREAGAVGPARGPEDLALSLRTSALATRYQRGEALVLPELVECLQPLCQIAVRRYARRRQLLPPSIDLEDLDQQVWVIVDDLAHRWRSESGAFAAYVRVAMPFELERFLAHSSPARRSRTVRVESLDPEELLRRFGQLPGQDGREWPESLALREMMEQLLPLERTVLLLHGMGKQALREVAQRLGLTDRVAARVYASALHKARLILDLAADAPDGALVIGWGGGQLRDPADALEARRGLERLVAVLHESADVDGRLPGRAAVCAATRFSETRVAGLMQHLVDRGCIAGRVARQPGRLVHRTAAETLARALGESRG
ncbi:MAG: sigma-70 family RNA polymerase sigma factor [Chloroflexota bacterium]